MSSRVSSERLTVGDLFCGAGGFSEGFEQAGFEIKWGVDSWGTAALTFQRNHPRAKVYERNIMGLDPSTLERVNVVIGSAPCVHFSLANRGGNGDRKAGMKLVRRLMTMVRTLEPDYWVMENVPALQPDLEAFLKEGGARLYSGDLDVPARTVLDAADFDTPQRRRRLFSGNFPIPEPARSCTGASLLPLSHVLDHLPDPTKPKPPDGHSVEDPNYPGHSVRVDRLRDHFEDIRWRLSEVELRSSRLAKRRHAVYGKMSFPDSLDRPSRTITATRTRGSRSTIVVPSGVRKGGLRTLTLRESAAIQGFPLGYQFWAGSFSQKDELVGNAVPPTLARAIAHAILRKEGRPLPPAPVVGPASTLPDPLAPRLALTHAFSATRRFRGVIPVDWRHDHRVELDNAPPVRDHIRVSDSKGIQWKARLYLGYAKAYKCYELNLDRALVLTKAIVEAREAPFSLADVVPGILPIAQECANGFPDAADLQNRWTGHSRRGLGPAMVVRRLGSMIGKAFPPRVWNGRTIPSPITQQTLEPWCIGRGDSALSKQPVEISSRLALATLALTVVTERLNGGHPKVELLVRQMLSAPSLLLEGRRNETAGNSSTLKLRADPLREDVATL